MTTRLSAQRAENTPTPDLAAMTPDELAQATAQAMYEADACARALGIEILEVRAGYARLSMAVRPEFLNGHQICHGGLIFTLSDTAFAYACNSYNVNTVAAGCSIEFLRPVQPDEVLTAEAVEQILSGRNGVYDIAVTNRAGETVALFRGKSAQIRGNVIPVAE
jgi:acyl-CoA thioesterase